MTFAVVWEPGATLDIDQAWESSSPATRKQIAEAVEAIAKVLQDTPMQVGESRQSRETRVYSWSPITIHYRVVERLQRVRVFAARVYRQP